jgi:hypothetical protein
VADEQGRSAHVDQFVRERLPPPDLWPRMDWSGVPELAYPDHLNCTSELLDRWIATGEGERVAFRHEAGAWSYRRLFETANRIANVLVEDLGVVPGNRVLLRATNQYGWPSPTCTSPATSKRRCNRARTRGSCPSTRRGPDRSMR